MCAAAEVDESVDDAGGDAGVFAAAEVHRGRAREHAVDADDAEAHEGESDAKHDVIEDAEEDAAADE